MNGQLSPFGHIEDLTAGNNWGDVAAASIRGADAFFRGEFK
jgi:hypothetical protein